MSFRCPGCSAALRQAAVEVGGSLWECTTCRGRFVRMRVLARVLGADAARAMSASMRLSNAPGGRACAACRRPMSMFSAGNAIDLDGCAHCDAIWFDRREYYRSGGDAPVPKQRQPPSNATAVFQARCRSQPWLRWPVLCYLVAAACIATTAYGWIVDPSIFRRWSFIPDQAGRNWGATSLFAFFLHLNPAHLMGNLSVLVFFGKQIEPRLGHVWMGSLLLVATLVGFLIHAYVDPRQSMPCIGASGGIAGVLTYACLRFPHREMDPDDTATGDVEMSAITWFVIWILSQAAGLFFQAHGLSWVSYAAHVGGAGVGLVWWLAWRTRLLVERSPRRG